MCMQTSIQRAVEGALGPWHYISPTWRFQHIYKSRNPCNKCRRSDVSNSNSKSSWRAWHVRGGLVKVSCGWGPLALATDHHCLSLRISHATDRRWAPRWWLRTWCARSGREEWRGCEAMLPAARTMHPSMTSFEGACRHCCGCRQKVRLCRMPSSSAWVLCACE